MNKQDAAKVAEMFLLAAELVDYGSTIGHRACCSAIGFAQADVHAPSHVVCAAKAGFATAFRPKHSGPYWFGHPWTYSSAGRKALERRKQHRIFAMLFMHELAKDLT